MKHTKDKRLFIRITSGELVELQEHAKKQGKTASEYARKAITESIKVDNIIKERYNVNI